MAAQLTALCRRVVDEGADEAGNVVLVTDCVTEALKNFERRGIRPAAVQRPPSELAPVPLRAAARGKPWRNALAISGVALMLVFGLSLYLRPSPPETVSAPIKRLPAEALSQTAKADQTVAQADAARKEADERVRQAELAREKAEEERKAEERRVAAVGLEAEKKEALPRRSTRGRFLEETARQAESVRRRAVDEQAEAARKEADERTRQAELARTKAEEERKAGEQRAAEVKRQQEERRRLD